MVQMLWFAGGLACAAKRLQNKLFVPSLHLCNACSPQAESRLYTLIKAFRNTRVSSSWMLMNTENMLELRTYQTR